MKFEKLGKEQEKVMIEIGPYDFGESNIIRDLENTLEFIKEKNPKILDEYTKTLTKKLLEITTMNGFKDELGKLAEHIKRYASLEGHIELLRLLLSYFTKTLGVTEEQFWQNEQQAFPEWNFFHSVRDLHLLELKVLIDILGKEKAIELYQKITDHYVDNYNQNQKGWYKDLEEMRESYIRFLDRNTWGRVRLISDVENGHYIEICLTCDKVRTYKDKIKENGELLDVTGCYCHIGLAKLWNENFVLTMKHTLAKGDPYCTYVYHDTRIADKIDEPSKEFIEGIISKFKSNQNG